MNFKFKWSDIGPPVEPGRYKLDDRFITVSRGDKEAFSGEEDLVIEARHAGGKDYICGLAD